MDEESPRYGFTERARPEYLRALDTVVAALQDPRNAWIGAGPMAALRWTPKAALNSYEMLSKVPGRYPQFLREKLGLDPDEIASILDSFDSTYLPNVGRELVAAYPTQTVNPAELSRLPRYGDILRDLTSRADVQREHGATTHLLIHPGQPGAGWMSTELRRQVASLLDEILAGKRTLGYGPEPPRPGSFAAYLKAYPIDRSPFAEELAAIERERSQRLGDR